MKDGLLKRTQKETVNLNSPVSIQETEFVFNNLPQKSLQVQIALLVNSIKHFKKKSYQFNTNSSRKIKKEMVFPNSFYETSITLIPKPDKVIT